VQVAECEQTAEEFEYTFSAFEKQIDKIDKNINLIEIVNAILSRKISCVMIK
jgi:hypothetical protein